MKKVLIIAVVALTLSSCGNKASQVKDANVVEAFNDGHNARNSLSYHGTYKGTIPAASAPGIDVTIEILNDSTYARTQVYVGHEGDIFKDQGKYTWNEAGSTITLLGDDTPSAYFVAEGKLLMLDTEGHIITGDLADFYQLKQVQVVEN